MKTNELIRILGEDRVITGGAALKSYDCDAYTVDRSKPDAVVLPETTDEVAQIVRWCVVNEIPFTPRGAGTGLSGGALAALGGVIISTKRMTRIIEVDVPNRRLKAQTGIPNKRISDAVAEHGLHFAPDPSSQSVSTLGGNIAENSGGPHTLKYGVTCQHVTGLTMISAQGEVWEIGDKAGGGAGCDLVSLVVGSEGTLGIVTEAWVQLTPVPRSVATALIAFSEVRDATEAVASVIGAGIVPAALEFMDHGILEALRAAFGLNFPVGSRALLLVETDEQGGDMPASVQMGHVVAQVQKFQPLEVRLAANETERAQLWRARKLGIGAMGRLAPTIVTHDGVIPRSMLPEMLDFVYAVANKHSLGVANLFHAGDGNLHPCFYFDEREPGIVDRVITAGEEIMSRCIELGGSVSGEHGIGVEKLDLMAQMFTPADLNMQEDVKAIFATNTLCNPCKVIPNQKGCVEHRKRWRGTAW